MKRKTVWKILIGIMFLETLMPVCCLYTYYEKPFTPDEVEAILAEHPKTAEEFYAKVKKADVFGEYGIGNVNEYTKKKIISANNLLDDVTQPYASEVIEWYPQGDVSDPAPSIEQIKYVCGITPEEVDDYWIGMAIPHTYLILLSEDKKILGWTTDYRLFLAEKRHLTAKQAKEKDGSNGE